MLRSHREEVDEKLKRVAQPLKMKVLTKVGRDPCWRDIDPLRFYGGQIHEKLKCVAQPDKMEVLTEVGQDLRCRDR